MNKNRKRAAEVSEKGDVLHLVEYRVRNFYSDKNILLESFRALTDNSEILLLKELGTCLTHLEKNNLIIWIKKRKNEWILNLR